MSSLPSAPFEAFVIYVDINSFTQMVRAAHDLGEGYVAEFMSHTLDPVVQAIEAEGGEVFNFVGDAVVGLVYDNDAAAGACFRIAKSVNGSCEYISEMQQSDPSLWPYAPGGHSLKIGIEYGRLDVSTLSSNLLGSLPLVVGVPINTAARIAGDGQGNRCHIGEAAAAAGLDTYALEQRVSVEGKPGEGEYHYYPFDLGDIWLDDDGKNRLGISYWP